MPASSDAYDLQRFIAAQDPVYSQVIAELRSGTKRSHWMWFVFPQLAGLGSSYMANKFAIASLEEAKAYLAHPILGARLVECANAVVKIEGKDIHQIFGYPDDLKFHSSMTLFAKAAPDSEVFRSALDKYFNGQHDRQSLALLQG